MTHKKSLFTQFRHAIGWYTREDFYDFQIEAANKRIAELDAKLLEWRKQGIYPPEQEKQQTESDDELFETTATSDDLCIPACTSTADDLFDTILHDPAYSNVLGNIYHS